MSEKSPKEDKVYTTISGLIKKLNEYPPDTEICAGHIDKDGTMYHNSLIIKESNPLGDREREEDLLLWIGSPQEEDIKPMSKEELWDILVNEKPDK